MSTFKDMNGNQWSLRITIADYLQMKEDKLCDLEKLFDDQDFLGGLLDGQDLLAYLGILHILCCGQYEANGVKDEKEFFSLLDGEVLDESVEAFIEACIVFSPAHRRESMRESYTTLKMGLEKTGEAAAYELKKHRAGLLDKMEERAKKEIEKISSKDTL